MGAGSSRAWRMPQGRFLLSAAQLPLDSAFSLGVIAALGDDAANRMSNVLRRDPECLSKAALVSYYFGPPWSRLPGREDALS